MSPAINPTAEPNALFWYRNFHGDGGVFAGSLQSANAPFRHVLSANTNRRLRSANRAQNATADSTAHTADSTQLTADNDP